MNRPIPICLTEQIQYFWSFLPRFCSVWSFFRKKEASLLQKESFAAGPFDSHKQIQRQGQQRCILVFPAISRSSRITIRSPVSRSLGSSCLRKLPALCPDCPLGHSRCGRLFSCFCSGQGCGGGSQGSSFGGGAGRCLGCWGHWSWIRLRR